MIFAFFLLPVKYSYIVLDFGSAERYTVDMVSEC